MKSEWLILILLASGCGSPMDGAPRPPENPAPVDAVHYQRSSFTLNGQDPDAEAMTISVGDPIRVEGEITLAPGLRHANMLPGTVSLVSASDNDDREETAHYTFLQIVEEPEPGLLRVAADWTPEAPPGRYELRMTCCPIQDGDNPIASQTTVYRSVVTVVAPND